MVILVRFIGILMACMGAIVILSPNVMKKMISFWRKGNRLYAGGVVRVLLGVVFLLSAPQTRLTGVIYTLGILMLLGGIVIFILGVKKLKAILDWWDKLPHYILRLMGFLILAIGALVIYCA